MTRRGGDMPRTISLPFIGIAITLAAGFIIVVATLSLVEWGLRSLALAQGVSPKTILVVLAVAGTCLALLVLESPIVQYITVTQRARRRVISSYYRPETIAEYLQQFWAARDRVRELLATWKPGVPLAPSAPAELAREFDSILDEHFGTKRFFFPDLLLMLVGFFVLYFAIQGGLAIAKSPQDRIDANLFMVGIRVDVVSIAAIFGAYTWITTDAIGRNYQGMLNSSNLYWYALRFVIAVALGQAMAVTKVADAAFTSNSGAAIAFLVSMFSYERISAIASGLVSRAFPNVPGAAADESADVIIKLPGVDQVTAEILSAEGITTIARLASADPVRVAVRTGFPFDQV